MPTKPTGRPRGRPPYPGLLTPAESRVLELLREGRTNPEISAVIGVSVDTVKYHVANILSKTGVRDRWELAQWREEREPDGQARQVRMRALAALRWPFVAGSFWGRLAAAAGVSVTLLVTVVATIIVIPRVRVESDTASLAGQGKGSATAAATALVSVPPVATLVTALAARPTDASLMDVSCVSPGWCMAVGWTGVDGARVPTSGVWAGGGLDLQSLPKGESVVSAQLSAVSCVSVDDCVAVGFQTRKAGGAFPLVMRLHGGEWKTEPVGRSDRMRVTLMDVACWGGGDCVAVGARQQADRTAVPVLLRRHGRAWTRVGAAAPVGTLSGWWSAVDCDPAGACVITGTWKDDKRVHRSYVEELNAAGVSTELLPSAGANTTSVSDVDCARVSECVVVGTYDEPRRGTLVPLMFTSKGGIWTWLVSPDKGWSTESLAAVSCSERRCMAVGGGYDESGAGRAVSYVGDGRSWTTVAVPTVTGQDPALYGVSCVGDSFCLAVGRFAGSDGEMLPLAFLRDGASWTREVIQSQ